MDDDPGENEKLNFHSIYTNVCLTLIVICLIIIAVSSLIDTISKNSTNHSHISKISICDPQNGRCAKVNAGRRLETTN